MLTLKHIQAAGRHVGDGMVAIAFADFGNGLGLVYGLAQRPDGQFTPFSMTAGREDFRFWPELASDDMGVGQMVALIDRLMNDADPHDGDRS